MDDKKVARELVRLAKELEGGSGRRREAGVVIDEMRGGGSTVDSYLPMDEYSVKDFCRDIEKAAREVAREARAVAELHGGDFDGEVAVVYDRNGVTVRAYVW